MENLITKIVKFATVSTDKFKAQIKYLENQMHEDEQLVFCCQGYVKNKSNSFDKNCLIICTDKRLLFLDKKFDSHLLFDITIDSIITALLKPGISLSKIIISDNLSTNETILYNLDKKHALALDIFLGELTEKSNTDIDDINVSSEKDIDLTQHMDLINQAVNEIVNEKLSRIAKTVSNQSDSDDDKKYDYIDIYVAGSSFYQKQIKELITDCCYYEKYNGYTNSEIRENGDGYIEWEIPSSACSNLDAEFIEEPDNEFDENAIKILIDGIHVGYVPKEQTKKVKSILNNITCTLVEVHGGKYKEVLNDSIYTKSKKISLAIYIKYIVQA